MIFFEPSQEKIEGQGGCSKQSSSGSSNSVMRKGDLDDDGRRQGFDYGAIPERFHVLARSVDAHLKCMEIGIEEAVLSKRGFIALKMATTKFKASFLQVMRKEAKPKPTPKGGTKHMVGLEDSKERSLLEIQKGGDGDCRRRATPPGLNLEQRDLEQRIVSNATSDSDDKSEPKRSVPPPPPPPKPKPVPQKRRASTSPSGRHSMSSREAPTQNKDDLAIRICTMGFRFFGIRSPKEYKSPIEYRYACATAAEEHINDGTRFDIILNVASLRDPDPDPDQWGDHWGQNENIMEGMLCQDKFKRLLELALQLLHDQKRRQRKINFLIACRSGRQRSIAFAELLTWALELEGHQQCATEHLSRHRWGKEFCKTCPQCHGETAKRAQLRNQLKTIWEDLQELRHHDL